MSLLAKLYSLRFNASIDDDQWEGEHKCDSLPSLLLRKLHGEGRIIKMVLAISKAIWYS